VTRHDWTAIAAAIRKVRLQGTDAATLDAVTEEVGAALRSRSSRFLMSEFRERAAR
jgi:hypothetical protein